MDPVATTKIVEEEWDAAIPSLQDFVRIPNLTTKNQPEWETDGLLDRAVSHVKDWVEAQGLADCKCTVLKDPGYSPFLYIEIGGTVGSPKAACTFLMYGHLDKQPWGPGWDEDIHPTSALIRDGRLYGRGSADDGYAVYASVIALKALQRQGMAHPRVIIIAETCEESGSPHLAHYVEKIEPWIGTPTAVYCLDSGIEDYSRFWMTTSLRGTLAGLLEVSVVSQGLHSGVYGGIVPDASRITRQLLNRLEDVDTGRFLVPELYTKIPVERQEQMRAVAESCGHPGVNRQVPFMPGAHVLDDSDVFAAYRANTWEPSLTVIGQDGLPVPANASPSLLPVVKTLLSVRLPPMVEHEQATEALKKVLERDPPCGATVKFDVKVAASGWNASELKPNLEAAVTKACRAIFDGNDPGYAGLGGTIPLMKMLGDMFPEASLVVCGVLGPKSNEHGPNESLHIGYTKKLTACVAMIMGLLEPGAGDWPDDVPKPASRRVSAAGAKKYCFRDPNVMVGACECCL
mmetsp:Transcript_113437/g.321326  ORF Transcript_113437/g.321326 Transcript_113437/m.321326 type:complete len:516 (+) Transcript_113437:82-1629(+)